MPKKIEREISVMAERINKELSLAPFPEIYVYRPCYTREKTQAEKEAEAERQKRLRTILAG